MIATTLEKNECLTEEFFERFQNTLSALVSNEEFKKAQQYPVVVTGGLKIDTFAFQRWVDKKYLYVVETLYDNQGFKIQLVNDKNRLNSICREQSMADAAEGCVDEHA